MSVKTKMYLTNELNSRWERYFIDPIMSTIVQVEQNDVYKNTPSKDYNYGDYSHWCKYQASNGLQEDYTTLGSELLEFGGQGGVVFKRDEKVKGVVERVLQDDNFHKENESILDKFKKEVVRMGYLKEMARMESIMNTIENNYDHEQKSDKSHDHATYYESERILLDEYIENARDIKGFEDEFNVSLFTFDGLKFPIIAFDNDSAYGGQVFDINDSREDIMQEANNRFKLLNDGAGVWEFEEYNVFEESVDYLMFEDKDRNELGIVMLGNEDDPIGELNKGADPIAEMWEDGNGNTINLNGWGEFEKGVGSENKLKI